MALRDRLERTVRRHAMLAGGETVLVGVSGGADSVALLHLLAALAPRWRLTLHVLHVDHGLRPDSARDAELVRALGARLAVPVEVATVTVDPRGSLEAAARAARYAALEARADRLGAQRIALAHTADDQAETVLMRLLEGAGVRGLAGIPPVRGRVVRPLLDCRRRELVAELRRARLPWVEDPSNQDPKFLRNRVRHELLPLLAGSYNPEIATALARVAALARDAVSALDRVATAELERLAAWEAGAVTLALGPLRALPRQVAAEVLRQAAGRLGSQAPLRAWAHRGLRRVLAAPPPRRPFRLGGVTLEVSGPRARLALAPLPALEPRDVSVPGRVELPEIGLALQATLAAAERYAIPDEPDRVAFDADRLPPALVVRPRRAGDRLTPFGGCSRKLKDLLIDAKVPRWERCRVPVVEAGGEIVWVARIRRGAAAPVTAATRRVLELALVPLAEPRAGR
ncbi:MAG: tRNA lysidine(34) synthetase TilS [candidate division NC10 bacterium]